MSNVDRIALLEYKIDVALKQMAQQDEVIKVLAGWMVGNAKYLAGVVRLEQQPVQSPVTEEKPSEEKKEEIVKEQETPSDAGQEKGLA